MQRNVLLKLLTDVPMRVPVEVSKLELTKVHLKGRQPIPDVSRSNNLGLGFLVAAVSHPRGSVWQ